MYMDLDRERCYLRRLLYEGTSPNTNRPLSEKGWLVPKWERYLELYDVHHGSYLAAKLLVDMTTNGMTPYYSGRMIDIRPRPLGDHEYQKLIELLPKYMQQVQWKDLLGKHLDELQQKAENEEKKAQAKQQHLALIRDLSQRIDSSVKAKADNSTESDPSEASLSSSALLDKTKEGHRGRSRSPR
jgi:hypothetical protein